MFKNIIGYLLLAKSWIADKTENTVARIFGEDSELQELWNETGESEKWHIEMNNLLSRLKS